MSHLLACTREVYKPNLTLLARYFISQPKMRNSQSNQMLLIQKTEKSNQDSFTFIEEDVKTLSIFNEMMSKSGTH